MLIEISNGGFDEYYFIENFFKLLQTHFENNPEQEERDELGNIVVSTFRRNLADYLDDMIVSAGEVHMRRKMKYFQEPDGTSESADPVIESLRIENGEEASSSKDDSSLKMWSFSSDEEEDRTVDMKTFIDNQMKKYEGIVSQIAREAQISLSLSMLKTAKENLGLDLTAEQFHLPSRKRKCQS